MRNLLAVLALLLVAGPTSLVLVRDDARWAILKDHSS
jgi:hypothetical protein